MAQKPTPTSHSSKSRPAAGSDPISSMMQAFLKAQKASPGPLSWFGNAWLEAFGEVGSELSAFIAERISEDVKTQHEMLHCKSPVELQKLQSRFVQKAIDDYTAETGRFVELNQKFLDRLRQDRKKT